jgi:PAB-dependent poly(A)-specific ribonuclease subunit 2
LYRDEQTDVWNVSLQNYNPRTTHLRYELRAMVVGAKNPLLNDQGHTVSVIKIDDKWFNFNDFSVAEAREDEVFHFGRNWKTPSILFYARTDVSAVVPHLTFQSPITLKRAFEVDHNYGIKKEITELPKSGDKVAIDAEFVVLQKNHSAKIKSSVDENQLFSLGRVTVLLDRGPDAEPGPFIDDYIATTNDTISDYMTRFSGLKAGDLDPENSTHHLTDLKWTYIKLRALVDMGVIFVGHGLKNDFKIISKNLYQFS